MEYRYATSEPNDRLEKGFDTAPADLSESGPRMSMVGYASALEHPHHHEISLSHRVGKTSLQAAVFYDRMVDPALTGVGEFSTDNGTVLPDIYSGTFTYQGSDLKTEGIRFVVQRKLTDDITATMDFEYGGVLDLEKPGVRLDDAQAMDRDPRPPQRCRKDQRCDAEDQDPLDRVLPLDQPRRAYARGYVQRLGGARRSLSEPLLPPAVTRQQFHPRTFRGGH